LVIYFDTWKIHSFSIFGVSGVWFLIASVMVLRDASVFWSVWFRSSYYGFNGL